MNNNLYKTIKYIFSIILIIFINSISYAKTIDINGIKANLQVEVTKKPEPVGSSVKEEKEKFSTIDYEKDNKEQEDKYVNVELSIRNNNPYEIANVTIEEIAPTVFRQVDNNNQNKTINVKLNNKTEKNYKFKYSYHKSIFKGQESSIEYDADGNILDENRKPNLSKAERDGIKISEDAKHSQKSSSKIPIFLLILLGIFILVLAFIILYKFIKRNEYNFNDKYYHYDDPFNRMVIFITLTIAFSLISHNNKVLAESKYIPQIYEYGKSYEKVIFEAVDFNGSLYRFAYKITVSFESNYNVTDEDYEKDTDGDLLVDALEYLYMTDKTNIDTDNDGLSDYIEVMFLDYNPLSEDTFKDSIKDGGRDYDGDGLTNIEEVRLGTDLCNVDTDYDTINDYEEINTYYTDPLNVDTDEDYLIDPDELKLGLDPTNPRTDGITLDSERKIEQTFTISNIPEELRKGDVFISNVSGKVSGIIDKELIITKRNEELFNSMSSFIQNGFEVRLKENEKIEIEMDVSKVSERKTTMTLVKYEEGEIEVVDTICEGNLIKASVGSGIYTVMDSDIVLRDLNIYIGDYIG